MNFNLWTPWVGVILLTQGLGNCSGEEPQKRALLEGHSNRDFVMAFSCDGKTLASGGKDRSINLWDMATGKKKATLKGHKATVETIAFSPDDKTLASGSDDGIVKVWDLDTGKPIASLSGHEDTVFTVAFTSDGKTLASGSRDAAIKLWNIGTGKELATLRGHTDNVHGLAFSPQGKVLASGSLDGVIKIWDIATGKVKATREAGPCYPVAFSPDGKTVAYPGQDREVKLWNVATATDRISLSDPSEEGLDSLAFSLDGKTLASVGRVDSLKFWNVSNGKERATIRVQSWTPFRCVFSLKANILATIECDGSIQLWDLRIGRQADLASPQGLAAKELDDLWTTLAQADERKAYQAIATLIAEPKQSVPFLKKQLRPSPKPRWEDVNRWIADLDSENFADREKASEALEALPDQAEPVLREKLAERPSSEVQRRIDQFLHKLEKGDLVPESVQALRAVEVLEHIGNSDAKQVLETLVKGAEGVRLTNEAKASLERLNKIATRVNGRHATP